MAAHNPPIYLDYNATAPIRPEAIELMVEMMHAPHNASSVHRYGRAAKAALERARRSVAEAISCFPDEVIFTGCGTEANNMVLKGLAAMPRAVSAVEHASVLQLAGAEDYIIPVDRYGMVHRDKLEQWLGSLSEPALVSVMLANNETGVIQPISEIAALVHKYGGLLHCDAVQALGKIPVDANLLGADMLSFSGHKIGAPPGIGALFLSQSVTLPAYIAGGGQESGRRAGTEQVGAIVAFAKALELALSEADHMRRLRGWLDQFEEEATALAGEEIIMGKGAARLPNTTAIQMPHVPSQTQLMQYDLAGFALSAGSACSSGRIATSHVIDAMHGGTVADEVIRLSAGWNTTQADIEAFSALWRELMTKNKGRRA